MGQDHHPGSAAGFCGGYGVYRQCHSAYRLHGKYHHGRGQNPVKRTQGAGGDTAEQKDGDVLVNGQVQDEPYIKEITEGDFGPYHVPEGCYFMMGDNRNDSLDARFWENTYVEKDAILGKVVLRYYKGFKIID